MPIRHVRLLRLFPALIAALVVLIPPIWTRVAHSDETPADSERSSAPIIDHRRKRSSVSLLERAGYIAREKTYLGTIYHSVKDTRLLHAEDRALIDVGANHDLRVGDYLTIFSASPMLRHQHTKKDFGRPVNILGVAKVAQVDERTAMIEITEIYGAVQVGDHVERYGVLPPKAPTVEPSANAVMRGGAATLGSVQGSEDAKEALAAGDIVFIDQGAAHGVKPGDRFWVYDEHRTVRHPWSNEAWPVAAMPIGELRILDVQLDSATAHVETSQHEFSPGAWVQPVSDSPYGLAGGSTIEGLLAMIPPCLEQAQAAIRAARVSGARPQDLADAEEALAYASTTFEQAQALLAQGNRERAHQLLRSVQADCLRAQHLAGEMNWRLAGDRYIVQPGDSLWGIAARPAIYHDPLLWPILYYGNRDRLQDPDVLYPRQEITVPRGYSQKQEGIARELARSRGPWRFGDGPDRRILDGFQP